MASLTLRRSDKFPVGTVVKAFLPKANRHHEGKPSGVAVAEATVETDGKLSFAGIPKGVYALWGEVAGANANLAAGTEDFTAPASLLTARVVARRALVGA